MSASAVGGAAHAGGMGGMPVAGGFAALAGQFVLQPGQRAAIVGTRPIAAADLLGQLLRGQHFAGAQARLGHVFTLCAHAHQRACALAFAAAWPTPANAPHSAPALGSAPASASPTATSQASQLQSPPQALPLILLRWETARDHLRSIALEWPQRLGGPLLQVEAMDWLRTCPLPLAGTVQPTVAQAISALAALHEWLVRDTAFPLQCLARWRERGHALAAPLHALNLLSDDAELQQQLLRQLGEALATEPGFTRRPQWQGACAETGSWTRLRHARHTRHAAESQRLANLSEACLPAAPSHASAKPVSAWTRLAARWQELQDIAAAPALDAHATHDPLLSSGALNLGAGQAIAWCEMARGLLLHWVQLDPQGAVAQYRVLAPTEWNFHPQGALALALSALDARDRSGAQILAAAFDACVECSVQTPAPDATTPEAHHA